MSDNIYCNIASGTPAAALITEWKEAIEKQRAWVNKFVRRRKIKGVDFVQNRLSVVGFCPRAPNTWEKLLEANPLWRREEPRHGISYMVPRQVGAEAKAVAKEWKDRPRIMSSDYVKAKMTGTDGFHDWMEGMTVHGMAWRIRDDGSVLAVIPYSVTKSKSYMPLEGFTIGDDQNALREEWHKDDDKKD